MSCLCRRVALWEVDAGFRWPSRPLPTSSGPGEVHFRCQAWCLSRRLTFQGLGGSQGRQSGSNGWVRGKEDLGEKARHSEEGGATCPGRRAILVVGTASSRGAGP